MNIALKACPFCGMHSSIGEGWAEEDNWENITHWCYCEEPTVTLGNEPDTRN